jgi:DNA processing protein
VYKLFEGIKPKVTTIYSRGNEELLSKDVIRLAIVGSRRMSDYGRRVIEEWVPMLVQRGIVTVSGLMTGVDQRIHEETVVCGGGTIGIAGW